MKLTRAITILTVVLAFAATAVADWDPGDGHKMHFPQLPDRQGWDVNFTNAFPDARVLADDWRCSQSGPVEDIHFWLSSRGDQLPPDTFINNIHVSIHGDDRSGAFSKPGELLWEADFPAGSFRVRNWGTGDQGFYYPENNEVIANDHHNIWQANITDIANPFIQKRDKIYWLDLSVTPLVIIPDYEFGWKTSMDHYEDNAVWLDTSGAAPGWRPLTDPLNGGPLDMAFVITPEPATVSLLCIGGLAILGRRRRRR